MSRRAAMYIASWSGGKDSTLACYRAIQNGMDVSHLVHFDRPNNLHGVDPELIKLQAELAGILLVQRKVDTREFEQEFRTTVGGLVKDGARGVIFGDIYLEPHKEWVDRTCAELGAEAIEPLWGMKTENIVSDFIDLGFETVVASGDQQLIDKKYIGRKMDRGFIDYLKAKNLDPCGENGEYHTFVTRGPLFKASIDIRRSTVTERDGFWFLHVDEYEVVS